MNFEFVRCERAFRSGDIPEVLCTAGPVCVCVCVVLKKAKYEYLGISTLIPILLASADVFPSCPLYAVTIKIVLCAIGRSESFSPLCYHDIDCCVLVFTLLYSRGQKFHYLQRAMVSKPREFRFHHIYCSIFWACYFVNYLEQFTKAKRS